MSCVAALTSGGDCARYTAGASRLARESESYYKFSGTKLECLKKVWMEPDRGFLSDEFYNMPGLGALYSRASLLRRVELVEPSNVIGRSTAESLQSGAVYGFSAMVEGMCRRIEGVNRVRVRGLHARTRPTSTTRCCLGTGSVRRFSS